ncbi:uncharacterized protein EI90DRAFT_3010738 [Cantharellus anzutake]|uniref:uncharacterized protein n=1 Tax=Cantharellus anzutake TaxID=1750568 RepID=UPI001906C96F|nr:uncharacterized protein EI90DRAFT_3010738 [Cantharellus anzutake]KAF8343871.1 hypothetical protein EI90DRAFT_3010738 [Cantharellus anzutake]
MCSAAALEWMCDYELANREFATLGEGEFEVYPAYACPAECGDSDKPKASKSKQYDQPPSPMRHTMPPEEVNTCQVTVHEPQFYVENNKKKTLATSKGTKPPVNKTGKQVKVMPAQPLMCQAELSPVAGEPRFHKGDDFSCTPPNSVGYKGFV